MITKDSIEKIVDDSIQGTNLFLVSVHVLAGNRIEVVLDSDVGVTIDDCVRISKSIESNFNRDEEDFELSVFSAGLSEPLILERQYLKNMGKEVEVLLKTGVKHKGTLLSIKDGEIEIKYLSKVKAPGDKRKKLVEEVLRCSLTDIKSTKLIIKV